MAGGGCGRARLSGHGSDRPSRAAGPRQTARGSGHGRAGGIADILAAMAATFTTVGRILTGADSSEELGKVAAGLGRRALLVTGRGALRSAGISDRLTGSLESAGVEVSLFEEVEPEPGVETVDRARAALREGGCDLVVAAGGGSAIDVGKAAAALAEALAPTGEYFTGRPVPESGRPCIAIPTTAGTGAEVTPNSVLTDAARDTKQSIRGPGLLPEVAIVDPTLTVSCPPVVTAAAGMDALVQAIESYLSRRATPLTEAMSLQAVELIWKNILAAHQAGDDLPAREAMCYGALLAGMALANARLGAVHGLAHAIGHRCRVRHGVVCAVLLPHVLRFNREAALEKYEVLSGLLGVDPAEAAAWLLVRLGMPQRLGEVGLSEADFDYVTAESMPSGSLAANPRPATAEDVRQILRGAL